MFPLPALTSLVRNARFWNDRSSVDPTVSRCSNTLARKNVPDDEGSGKVYNIEQHKHLLSGTQGIDLKIRAHYTSVGNLRNSHTFLMAVANVMSSTSQSCFVIAPQHSFLCSTVPRVKGVLVFGQVLRRG